MSAETVSKREPRPGTAQAEGAPRVLRMLGMTAVCAGIAALAGGTFVLSYSGIHVLALHAGIAPRLARGYPLLIDAMLVIVLAAVLALRGANLPSKLFAWTTLLAVLAAAAGADALHAAGRRLPKHVAAITAAVLPWVLLFLAFALLLAMLRHARLHRLAIARALPAAHGDAPAGWLPGSQHEDPQPRRTGAAGIVPGLELPVWQQHPPSALSLEPGQDDPASDESAVEPAGQDDRDDRDGPIDQTEETGEVDQGDETAARAERAEEANLAGEHDEQDDPDMPVFHRMWSSPTPPEQSA